MRTLNLAVLSGLIQAFASPAVDLLYLDKTPEVDYLQEKGLLQIDPAVTNPANPEQVAGRLLDKSVTAENLYNQFMAEQAQATTATPVADTAAWATPSTPAAPAPESAAVTGAAVQVPAANSGFDYDVPFVAGGLPIRTGSPTYDFAGLRQQVEQGHSQASIHVPNKTSSDLSSAVSNANKKLKKEGITDRRFASVKAADADPRGTGTRIYYVNTDGTPIV